MCCSRSIKAYAAYLDTLEEAEEEHPACTANRLLLEHTWQACCARTVLQAHVRLGMQTELPSLPAPHATSKYLYQLFTLLFP